jgi:lipid A 3-O-deacylase
VPFSFRALAFLILAAPATSMANAQDISLVRFEVDNDYFDFWQRGTRRTDDNYTHGARLDALLLNVPRWLRWRSDSCAGAPVEGGAKSCVAAPVSIVQQVFTPRYDTPPETDRPYAGVLFVDVGRTAMTPRHAQTFSVKLGTTGAASGGKAVQQFMHDLNKSGRVFHWEHEIEQQVVANASYEGRLLLAESLTGSGRVLSLTGGARGTAGTLESGASAGLELRLGHRVAHPWLPLADVNRRKSRAFLVFAAEPQWVARSLVLDGNSTETRGLVTRRPVVFQWTAGGGYGLGRFMAEYRATSRSREYDEGPSWHRWGTLGITYMVR